MRDPYQWLPGAALRPALIILFFSCAALLTAMIALDQALITEASPRGIVSFELAGNIQQALLILNAWNQKGKIYAALSLGLDYMFLVVYALFISIACVLIARKLMYRFAFLAQCGIILGWSQFAAALLDAIENAALIRIILDSQLELWSIIARWCAIVKFGIVAAGLVYILIGISLLFLQKVLRFSNSYRRKE